MIDTDVKSEFLALFYHDIIDRKLDNDNRLNAFTLKIQNNSFAYNELVEKLGDNLNFFALSRQELKILEEQRKHATIVNLAKQKLRNYVSNEGELGEILLYCLLESHLNAPKILTKLELKTANNDYVKGADGVHLLKLNEKDYQLVIGESKLDSDLQKGIYDAFASINKLLKDDKSKLNFEMNLVNSQLVKEAFNEDVYNKLKKILLPSANDDKTNLDYSFGIFLGFNISIADKYKKLSNSNFRTKIRDQITEIIESNISSINYQLKKDEFVGYNFYLYIIPFSDLETKRKEIIGEISK